MTYQDCIELSGKTPDDFSRATIFSKGEGKIMWGANMSKYKIISGGREESKFPLIFLKYNPKLKPVTEIVDDIFGLIPLESYASYHE